MERTAAVNLKLICEVIRQTAPAEQIYLFGSYAYGVPNKDSDLDLYAVLPDDGPRPLKAMQDIRYALFQRQNMPLDILVSNRRSFERRRADGIGADNLSKGGAVVWGKR